MEVILYIELAKLIFYFFIYLIIQAIIYFIEIEVLMIILRDMRSIYDKQGLLDNFYTYYDM